MQIQNEKKEIKSFIEDDLESSFDDDSEEEEFLRNF